MNLSELPEGFSLIREIDLAKDKKTALWLNIAALIIGAIMAAGALILRAPAKFDGQLEFTVRIAPALGLAAGIFAYIFLHEGVHGLFMKLYGSAKVKYGFTGLFAYAGSGGFHFDRLSYAVIALAPLLILGLALLALNLVLPSSLFWYVYILQILNVSGAVGDAYVTLLICKMPPDTLVNDTGLSMRFYSAQR